MRFSIASVQSLTRFDEMIRQARLAEEGAMVDALSGGRLRLGASAGYSETDLGAYDVDPHNRGKIME